MDINELEKRNEKYINMLINKYNIEFTYEELINDFKSIFVHTDFDLCRLRLMGVQKIYDYLEDSNEKIETNKTKRVQIYVLKKRDFEKLKDTELQNEMENLNFIVNMVRETQSILNIKNHERGFEFMKSFKIFE